MKHTRIPFGAIKPHAFHVDNRFNNFPSNYFGIQIVKSTARSIKSYFKPGCSVYIVLKNRNPRDPKHMDLNSYALWANLNSILLHLYSIIAFGSIYPQIRYRSIAHWLTFPAYVLYVNRWIYECINRPLYSCCSTSLFYRMWWLFCSMNLRRSNFR